MKTNKYYVTVQYSVNEVHEVEATDVEHAIDLAKHGEGEITDPAEFRDWLEPSNWPVYNATTEKQEN